jgi:hypothetical protein
MASDRSRRTDRSRDGYKGVVAQQGRVILDRDFNAQQALEDARVALDALNFVGPCGAPGDGFKISLGAAFRPLILRTSSPPSSPVLFDRSFTISPGVMFIGGQAAILPASFAPIGYETQPDWPAPDPAPAMDRELVYLELQELEVSAVEDPDLFEVALGGPDTTQRLRLLRRVKRLGVQAADCHSAWLEAIDGWRNKGFALDPATMSLTPNALMKIGFTTTSGSTNRCDPLAVGGYLGAENQLIRLRTITSDGTAQLLWSYDNASFLYRVDTIDQDRRTIKLTADPPDAFHFMQQGQWVEILPTAAKLGQETDATAPSAPPIIRAVAEPEGFLTTLTQAYGPVNSGDSANHLVLADPGLPTSFQDNGLPVFVRVWQSAVNLVVGQTLPIVDAQSGTSTGVTATVSIPFNEDQTLPQGAFWQIAVRPSRPQGVYPEDYLTVPQPPDGLRRWVCPLAFIDWAAAGGAKLTDCRNTFDNLVALSKRRNGCCSISVNPADLKAGTSLQSILDRAATLAALGASDAFMPSFTVCLEPGDYPLFFPLRLDSRHSGLVLECCGGTAVLAADPNAKPDEFADGLLVATSVAGLTLRGLELHPVEASIPAATLKAVADLAAKINLDLHAALRAPRLAIGLRMLNCVHVTLETCVVIFQSARPDNMADLIGAAIFAQGDCSDLRIDDCTFTSDLPPTFNLLQLDAASSSTRFNNIVASLTDAAAADRASFTSHTGLPLAAVLAARTIAIPGGTSAPALNAAIAAASATSARGAASTAASTTDASATSPPQSDVLSTTEIRDQVMLAGFAAVIVKRLAQPLAAPVPIIATTGVLAADHGSLFISRQELPCLLGNCEITGSSLSALAVCTWLAATPNTLRFQSNICSNTAAGLWAELTGATAPPLATGVRSFFPQVEQFEEFLLIRSFAIAFPPPQDTSPSPPRRIRRLTPLCAFIVQDNFLHMKTGPSTGNTSGSASSSALMLSLCRSAQNNLPTEMSAIVSANHLRSGSAMFAPTALVTLPALPSMTATGNIIENRFGDRPNSDWPSLWIEDSSTSTLPGGSGIAVVGNTLSGSSTLGLIPHPVPATITSWEPFNTR